MLIFHALARMGIEALVIVSPKIPLVSIGYFQDAKQEVNLQYCIESKIPFMRREVGGGATYLRVETFYEEKGIESPGVESKDFATTILNSIRDSKKD